MLIDKDTAYTSYMREIHAMRTQYVRDLLSTGWSALIGFIRARAQALKWQAIEKTGDVSARLQKSQH